jgi:hypothetical protein
MFTGCAIHRPTQWRSQLSLSPIGHSRTWGSVIHDRRGGRCKIELKIVWGPGRGNEPRGPSKLLPVSKVKIFHHRLSKKRSTIDIPVVTQCYVQNIFFMKLGVPLDRSPWTLSTLVIWLLGYYSKRFSTLF